MNITHVQFHHHTTADASTSTSRGACASARTATSIHTSCATASRNSDYISALLADLEQELPAAWGRPVDSVFFGGGTPSLFSPEGIDRLLGELRARLTLQPGAEITLEANPGTVDHERFQGYHAAGINRLSIGVQSFQPELLEKIGRIHGRRDAIRAAEAAHAAGFDNFNLDLMFGLPGQTQPQAMADLRIAMDLEPTHLSWYELTIEPNTWFHRHPPQLPDDDAALVDANGWPGTAGSARLSHATRCQPMPAPADNAGTTSTTGCSATTSESAPAHTAS